MKLWKTTTLLLPLVFGIQSFAMAQHYPGETIIQQPSYSNEVIIGQPVYSSPTIYPSAPVVYDTGSVVHSSPATSAHCSPGTSGGDCWPSLLRKCHCRVQGTPVPISGTKGTLQVDCKSEYFYRGIEPREAKVPVPQICVNARERYDFRPITLEYDCKDAHCPNLKCDFGSAACNDCCKVSTCEVYQCVTDCELECELVIREGTVLIAVRRRPVGGQLVADVVIGREGKIDFPAYPENTVILRAATAAQIKARLGITVNLASIRGTTDLKSLIK